MGLEGYASYNYFLINMQINHTKYSVLIFSFIVQFKSFFDINFIWLYKITYLFEEKLNEMVLWLQADRRYISSELKSK